MTRPRLTDELKIRFALYGASNPEWGPMHVVLADGNLWDESAEWCLEWAQDECTDDKEGLALAFILTQLSEYQRGRIYREWREWVPRGFLLANPWGGM